MERTMSDLLANMIVETDAVKKEKLQQEYIQAAVDFLKKRGVDCTTEEPETEYELRLKGFRTKEQVEAFFDWYGGQGEQDASVWFEERRDEGEIDVDFMPVDVMKSPDWENNVMTGYLKIY